MCLMKQVLFPNLSDDSESWSNADSLWDFFSKFRKVALGCSVDLYTISDNIVSQYTALKIQSYVE